MSDRKKRVNREVKKWCVSVKWLFCEHSLGFMYEDKPIDKCVHGFMTTKFLHLNNYILGFYPQYHQLKMFN